VKDKPVPERNTALLFCEVTGEWMWHQFVEARELTLEEEDGWEMIWECPVSGSQRRWGIVFLPEMN